MAAMENYDFGTPCKHIEQGIFAYTLTCKECRRIRQSLDQKFNQENRQKIAEQHPTSKDKQHPTSKDKQLPTRKDNQKAKIAARRLRKYGN